MRVAVIAIVLLAACVIVQSVGMLLLIHWLPPPPPPLPPPRRPRPGTNPPPPPVHIDRPTACDPDWPLGHGVLAGGRAADAGDRHLSLARHLHHDWLWRRRPESRLAGADWDRGPHRTLAGGLVDGVCVRGREPHVRALAADARRALRTPGSACGLRVLPRRGHPPSAMVISTRTTPRSVRPAPIRHDLTPTTCPHHAPSKNSRPRAIPSENRTASVGSVTTT